MLDRPPVGHCCARSVHSIHVPDTRGKALAPNSVFALLWTELFCRCFLDGPVKATAHGC